MVRIKTFVAALGLAAIVCLVPVAQAQTVKVLLSGSSAMWQTMALGAYNTNGASGQCVPGSGATAPCFHYTSGANFSLTDTRPSPVVNDTGAIWIVWDSTPAPTGPLVWAYIKVDSVVGVRCFFAQPHCNVNVAAFPGVGNQIAAAVWGDGSADQVPPASVQALFTAGRLVTGGATDIRPEDALFATCRANSLLGNGSGGGSGDGLDGLGYGTKPAGTCPVFADPAAAKVGTPIQSGKPGSTGKANIVAFNITGKDPFSNTTIPAAVTTSVGASPIVFIIKRGGALANLKNASETQLQTVFSGTRCNADVFGLPAGAIQAYLREPLSGTMNTTEATTFRRPTVPASGGTLGLSQETDVDPGGTGNPLNDACSAGGGSRYRAIGTGEAVNSVRDSQTDHGTDGIGYSFFSYGNISGIANNNGYGYITVNGVDPIFQSYGTAQTIDPGQPTTPGTLPAAANLPAACQPGGFPCSEHDIWGGGFSFPNLRNGVYRQWSVLRTVSSGTNNTAIGQLVTASNKFVVNSTPDYVPFKTVAGTTDLGLKLVRSHYQQKDGNGANLGPAPINTGADKGGDMGGCILPTTAGVTTSKQLQLIQNGTDDSLGCVKR